MSVLILLLLYCAGVGNEDDRGMTALSEYVDGWVDLFCTNTTTYTLQSIPLSASLTAYISSRIIPSYPDLLSRFKTSSVLQIRTRVSQQVHH